MNPTIFILHTLHITYYRTLPESTPNDSQKTIVYFEWRNLSSLVKKRRYGRKFHPIFEWRKIHISKIFPYHLWIIYIKCLAIIQTHWNARLILIQSMKNLLSKLVQCRPPSLKSTLPNFFKITSSIIPITCTTNKRVVWLLHECSSLSINLQRIWIQTKSQKIWWVTLYQYKEIKFISSISLYGSRASNTPTSFFFPI